MKYKVIIIKEVAAKIVNFHDMIPGTGCWHWGVLGEVGGGGQEGEF